jgi:heme-degrading monooxygenase HmoA/predicted ester cyclase
MIRKLWFPLIIACITLSALLICFAGCSLHQSENVKFKEAFIQASLDAYNKGDVNALDKFISPDFIMYCRPPEPDIKGLDAYKKNIIEFRRGFQNIQVTVESSIMEGNFSAWRGTWQATEMSTSKMVKVEVGEIYRWANGKAVECWNYSDISSLFQQLGYKMIPPITKTTFARVHINQMKPEKMAEVMQMYRERLVPVIKSQKGFLGLYRLTNDTTGKSISITLWDSEADAMASMEAKEYQVLSNEFADKYKDSLTAKDIREGYLVTVQE